MVEIKMHPDFKDENREAIVEIIDFTVKSLMEVRRVCELDGTMTIEEFDEKLNESSEKWYEHFRNKSLTEIMTKRMFEMLMDSLGDTDGN